VAGERRSGGVRRREEIRSVKKEVDVRGSSGEEGV
jgi:hypothetical protein